MDYYPLTQSQQLIYDMEKFAGGSIANICGSMLFGKQHTVEEINSAICQVYNLNDALRIRLKESGGAVQQYVCENEEIHVDIKQFSSKKELNSFGEIFAKEPMGIGGSLSKFIIAILPEQTGVIVKLHHLIGDAWTLSLLGSQLNSILRGETPEAYSYIDHISNEEKYLSGKRYKKDREFFETQFKSCDEATFLSEKQAASYNVERSTFTFNKEANDLLRSYAERNGVSPFNVILTAVSIYFSRVKMNAELFYIGTAVLNRAGTVEQNTAGMFINTVPVLINLKNELSFADNLQVISATAFAVMRHEKFNYGELLSFLRNQYHFSEKLYDVIFSYQNAVVEGECESVWYPCGMQTESLQIHAEDRDNTGGLKIHYDFLTDKFTAQEIEAMHSHICNLLFDAINNDDKKPYELNILSPEERQKVQFDFNGSATAI